MRKATEKYLVRRIKDLEAWEDRCKVRERQIESQHVEIERCYKEIEEHVDDIVKLLALFEKVVLPDDTPYYRLKAGYVWDNADMYGVIDNLRNTYRFKLEKLEGTCENEND